MGSSIPHDDILDKGIQPYVEILQSAGIETFESCEGGQGHAFHKPTIRFHGEPPEGYRAFACALTHGLPVSSLRRVWRLRNGELVGPIWEMEFYHSA